MLVCNVSLRPRRAGIAAEIVEAGAALDATTTGTVVFATLVDDPAFAQEIVGAFVGQIMVEAASASATVTAGSAFAAAIIEAATAADASSSALAGVIAADVAEAATAADAPSATVTHWTTTTSATLSIDSMSWAGNLRQVIPAGLISTSGTACRITFEAAVADAAQVGAAYIQHAATSGDAYDFLTTPVQITVGGATTWTVAAGSTVVTDSIAFAIDETKNLVISVYFPNSADDDVRAGNVSSGASTHFKAGANDAATVNAAGYSNTSGGNSMRFINRIEVS